MRLATIEDIPRITDLVERLVTAAQLPQVVDRHHTGDVLANLMGRGDAVIWLSASGFLAGSIECTVISPELIAVEHGWYSEGRDGLRLLRAFEVWAAARGARVRLSTGVNGPDLTRLGFRPVEKAWVR